VLKISLAITIVLLLSLLVSRPIRRRLRAALRRIHPTPAAFAIAPLFLIPTAWLFLLSRSIRRRLRAALRIQPATTAAHNALTPSEALMFFALAVSMLTVLGSGCVSLVARDNWNKQKAFYGHMSQFYDASLQSPPARAGLANPYIAGRIIVVPTNKDDTIDDFFWSLPGGLRAKTPDEVGTVISKPPCKKSSVGQYQNESGGNGGVAYRWHCSLTIIDYRKGVIVGKKTFYGSDPPEKAQANADEAGDKPKTGDMVAWITGMATESLPRKK